MRRGICVHMANAPEDPVTECASATDQTLRAAWERGEYRLVASLALEAHGPDILSFLMARLRSASDGEEVFAMFAEDMWRGLPGFAFRCSMRTWLYTVARNAATRYASSPARRAERNLDIALCQSVSAMIHGARSATAAHRRTDVQAKMRALRERLPVEDQTLLILHIDRGLTFPELAMVMHDDGERLAGATLATEVLRLRKRFERLKAALREMAIAEGIHKR